MTSPRPLTEAERAAATLLWELDNATRGPFPADSPDPEHMDPTFRAEARAVVAAVRPLLAAEFYESMADATENCGPMSAEGFRALALMVRQSLSRPTSEEGP